jgi:hypothetical protein
MPGTFNTMTAKELKTIVRVALDTFDETYVNSSGKIRRLLLDLGIHAHRY